MKASRLQASLAASRRYQVRRTARQRCCKILKASREKTLFVAKQRHSLQRKRRRYQYQHKEPNCSSAFPPPSSKAFASDQGLMIPSRLPDSWRCITCFCAHMRPFSLKLPNLLGPNKQGRGGLANQIIEIVASKRHVLPKLKAGSNQRIDLRISSLASLASLGACLNMVETLSSSNCWKESS